MSAQSLSNETELQFSPSAGITYNYEISETKEVEQTMDSQENKVKLTINTKIELLYKIINKLNSQYEVTVEIENYSIDSWSGDELQENIISNRAESDSFKGTIFAFPLANDGSIKRFKCLRALPRKLSAPSISDSVYTDKYFKGLFETLSNILPGKKVFVNSSWMHNRVIELGEPQSSDVEFRVDSIDREKACIKTTSPVEQTISALNHTVQLKGKEEGLIEVESATGMLLKSSQMSIIMGSLKIGEVHVDMNIRRISTITGKRV